MPHFLCIYTVLFKNNLSTVKLKYKCYYSKESKYEQILNYTFFHKIKLDNKALTVPLLLYWDTDHIALSKKYKI